MLGGDVGVAHALGFFLGHDEDARDLGGRIDARRRAFDPRQAREDFRFDLGGDIGGADPEFLEHARHDAILLAHEANQKVLAVQAGVPLADGQRLGVVESLLGFSGQLSSIHRNLLRLEEACQCLR